MAPPEMIVIPEGATYWWNRSDAELEALRIRDAAAGHFHDSAGESLVYDSVGSRRLKAPTLFTITKRKGFPWKGWARRPTYLVIGLLTIDGVPREVMVRDPRRVKEEW